MSSKRYVVFSNDNGTEATSVEFDWPVGEKDSHPGDLMPIGIAYHHLDDEKTSYNAFGEHIVGKPLSGNPQISDLVGKVLTIADAMFVDKEQREAFKSLMRQTLYGYANEKEEQVRQTFGLTQGRTNKA